MGWEFGKVWEQRGREWCWSEWVGRRWEWRRRKGTKWLERVLLRTDDGLLLLFR